MDFRMDKASWFMLAFIFGTFVYFILQGAGGSLPAAGWLQAVGFALLGTAVLTALACIPVFIICLIINRIPDIDYSIWGATAFTVVGIISELI